MISLVRLHQERPTKTNKNRIHALDTITWTSLCQQVDFVTERNARSFKGTMDDVDCIKCRTILKREGP